jgi:hypothetical protein
LDQSHKLPFIFSLEISRFGKYSYFLSSLSSFLFSLFSFLLFLTLAIEKAQGRMKQNRAKLPFLLHSHPCPCPSPLFPFHSLPLPL